MRVLVALVGLVLALVVGAEAQTAPYRLQPGDTIGISVWQDSKLDRQLVVGPDGSISVPLAGRIVAGGQTLAAVEGELKQRLQSSYKTNLDVSVALASSGAKDSPYTIFVTGEVNRPGPYPIAEQGTTALQAIALSGGFSPFAATKRIQVIRSVNGQSVQFAFNYDDLLAGRDASGNVPLRPGDVVVVPEKGLFGR